MIKTHTVLALAAILILPLHGADESKPHSVIPKNGYVPDEQTAIAIAVAVWIPIYGKENIARQTPYQAKLKEGIWYVTGSVSTQKGGAASAEIQKTDAKVLRVSHGK